MRAIAARHGLGSRALAPIAHAGIINAVYQLGDDLVLRVPRNHPVHIEQARVEAVAIRAARNAGVRTPALLAYDDACDLLPVPYLLVERVDGRTLAALDLQPGATPDLWRELGRELARLHTSAGPAQALGEPWIRDDPRVLAERRASDGCILWRHLQWSLSVLPRGATPGLSWGEHPISWLLEVLRFFLDGPPPRWRSLTP